MNIKAKIKASLPDYIASLRAATAAHAPEAVKAREGYTISNAGDVATIRIYDEIWWLGVNAEDFANDLDAINASSIVVQINSPGGDVFDGIAIYNALRNHPARITTQVDGLAASIASVIFQAGDTRLIQPSGQLMIHNAWGVAVGDRHEHADMAALLEQQDEVIAGIYAEASGRPAEDFRTLMDAETWMTAQRAIDDGLADEIVTKDEPVDNKRKPLTDRITDARAVLSDVLDDAEEVRSLRAQADKPLTNVVLDSLRGLADDVGRLAELTTETTHANDDADANREAAARLVALQHQGVIPT